MARAEMKRSGFKRPQRLERAPIVHKPLAAPVVYAVIGDSVDAMPKVAPVRSEAYRRAVAALPCVICKIAGISQCAHANTGKGAGIKASDLESFPLCACQPGRQGCHSKFDQGALYTKAARRLIEPAWIADTQRRIHTMGQWPKGIPYPHEHIEG